MQSSPITLMCVDDHRIVRQGIELIVGREPDMHVVASVGSGEEAIDKFRTHHPDVTLMDLQLRGITGIETIRRIRQEAPLSQFVVLTMYTGDEDIYQALDAGAATYILKDSLADDLIRVIRDVHAGTHRLRPDIATRLAARATGPTLTSREVQITALLAQGMRNKEIAASLGISTETVQVHVKSILSKLHVNDRSAAITVALRRGIIHLS